VANPKIRIVCGENCTGVRHFDGISFINYVLGETTKSPTNKTAGADRSN
jgi:hypothetical protein